MSRKEPERITNKREHKKALLRIDVLLERKAMAELEIERLSAAVDNYEERLKNTKHVAQWYDWQANKLRSNVALGEDIRERQCIGRLQ